MYSAECNFFWRNRHAFFACRPSGNVNEVMVEEPFEGRVEVAFGKIFGLRSDEQCGYPKCRKEETEKIGRYGSMRDTGVALMIFGYCRRKSGCGKGKIYCCTS